jgi:hypothetical protein
LEGFNISGTVDFISKVKNYIFPVLLGLGILNAILNGFGIVPARYLWFFIWIAVAVEAAFLIVLIFKITKVVQRYKQLRKEENGAIFSLRKALEIALPPLAAKWVVIELQLYYILFKSLGNKGEKKEGAYLNILENYRFFFKVFIVLCVLEIVAVTALISNKWMTWKIVHFIIGIWVIAWLAADYNAMKLYSNEIDFNKLRLQMGLRCCQDITWEQIIEVNKVSKSGSTFSFGPEMPEDEPGVLYLIAGETCNVEIELKEPQDFQGMIKDFKAVKKVYLALSEPDIFIEQVKKKIARVD